MTKKIFSPGELLIPGASCNMTKWSVVACDQFTSEPEYWESVSAFVGNAPSTLHITFPEIYLEQDNEDAHIASINAAMKDYLTGGVFAEAKDRYIYVERTQRDGKVRHGLMGIVDLEEYDYTKASQSKIRATEGTVLERIPPRVRIRKDAPLEIPHIMLLIDDREKSVIEPLYEAKNNLDVAYDFSLMENSGKLKGYFVSDDEAKRIDVALEALASREGFEKKYSVSKEKGVLLFAVGDGNHSLATAKECFNKIKETLPESEWKNHPARYALCELVNLHDAALEFEPIHRVLFGVDSGSFLKAFEEKFELSDNAAQKFTVVTQSGESEIGIANPTATLTVGTLQAFIDDYLAENGGKVDYIHGDDVVKRLGSEPGNMGFLLPVIRKDEFFSTVIRDGALPRKTFSMGHAWDKRFYLEARKITKDF